MDTRKPTKVERIRRAIVLLIGVTVGLLSMEGYAYESETHRLLTRRAIDHLLKQTDLNEKLKSIGLKDGIDEKLGLFGTLLAQRPAREWTEKGSVVEDKVSFLPFTLIRVLRHFQDPLEPVATAGLQIPEPDSPPPVLHFESAIEWAHKIEGTQAGPQSIFGNMSWRDARKYFRLALIEDRAAKREHSFLLTFKALGHVMHLIQDTSVPAHVRNDVHATICASLPASIINPLTLINVCDPDEFHGWVEQNRAMILSPSFTPKDPANALLEKLHPELFLPIANLIDADVYRPDINNDPDTTLGLNSGIAEFANANFFSDDTIHVLRYPHPSLIDIDPLATDLRYSSLIRNGSVFIRHVFRKGVLGIEYLDNVVFEDYAKQLLPRAVGYSAAVLKYFFRGKIDVTFPAADRIQFTNKSNEDMDGTFSVYYDDTSGKRIKIADYTFSSPLGPTGTPTDTSPERDFTIPTSPVPANPGEYIVVFEGTLGVETDAVVGTQTSNIFPILVFASDRIERLQIWTVQPEDPVMTLTQVTTAGSGQQESRSPSWSLIQNRIAYQFGKPTERGIHMIRPDGADDVRLTFFPAAESDPSWAPDGQSIAYARQVGPTDVDIWIHNIGTSCASTDYSLLSLSNSLDLRPAWAPDGTKIAFNTNAFPGPDSEIAVVEVSEDANGCFVAGPVIRLTDNSFTDFDPTWSPDSEQIAFSTARSGGRDIYRMSAELGEGDLDNFVRLTTNTAADRDPAWSPEGATIAFVSERDGNKEIYLMSADCGEPDAAAMRPAVCDVADAQDQFVRITDNPAVDDDPAWER